MDSIETIIEQKKENCIIIDFAVDSSSIAREQQTEGLPSRSVAFHSANLSTERNTLEAKSLPKFKVSTAIRP